MRRIIKPLTTLVAVLLFTSGTLSAQDDSWQRRWYWGAQSGVALQGGTSALAVGGHWFITGTRSALSVGFDALFYGNGSTETVTNSQSATGVTTIGYSNGRRLQMILYGIPNDNTLQVYGGAGIGISQISNAQPLGTLSNAELLGALARIEELDTKAFLIFVVGAQLRMGRMALFGEYKLFPAADTFLIRSDQHQISVGLRYSLTHANEEIKVDR